MYDVEPMHFLHHMQSSQAFILIKGEPKGLQIEKISLENKGLYAVKFKNSPQTFHYRYNDVVILDNAVWYDPMQIRVLIGGHQEWGITDVFSYTRGFKIYWRITYKSGYTRDLMPGTVELVHSCLSDDKARNVFEYLKRIAQTNELGKDEEHGGILPSLYDSIDFVPESLAAAPYLAPSRHFVKKHNSGRLIFPFGCNASQERAVTAAFEEQISVIQGPPGTGKTQTILNIIANLLLQGKTAIVVSNNNSATTNVQEKLQKYGLDFIVAPLGKRENKEEFIKAQPKVPEELKTWKLTKNESDDKWYINPGANVGYNTYEHYVKSGETGYDATIHGRGTEADPYKAIRDDGTDDAEVGIEAAKAYRREHYSYGSGIAHTIITGGRIHNVYGGSNQKGNVRIEAFTEFQQAGVCYMAIGETYPGGKNADTDGETNATADCVDEGGKIYGGAKSANVNNNVHIRITNGHYEGVYGGNNKAGTINGNITITIEESGCSPIIIDELCAGGYMAPYSVYGYKNTAEPAVDKKGNPIYDDDGTTQLMQRKPLTKGDTGALTTPYRDPQINIICVWVVVEYAR